VIIDAEKGKTMVQRYRAESIVRNATPLLSTESRETFEARRSEFRDHIKPRDIIERTYCDDFAGLIWETMRWRRAKTAISNLALREALYEVLVEKLAELEGGQESVEYLDRWFTDAGVKQEVSEMLAKYNLDESAIEVEAFRQCSSDLMLIEQLLAAAESRRDKALHNIAFYRQELAQQLRYKVIDAIRDEDVPRIEARKEVSWR
jgi:hypothetical protein